MKIYKRMESFKQEAALLVPLYKGDRIPDEITELLGYDVTNDISLDYETVNETLTMGKAEVKKIIFAVMITIMNFVCAIVFFVVAVIVNLYSSYKEINNL